MSAQHIYKLLHLFFGTAHALKEECNREARSCRGFATVKIHFFFLTHPETAPLPLFKHHSLEGKAHYFILLHTSRVRGGEKSIWRQGDQPRLSSTIAQKARAAEMLIMCTSISVRTHMGTIPCG